MCPPASTPPCTKGAVRKHVRKLNCAHDFFQPFWSAPRPGFPILITPSSLQRLCNSHRVNAIRWRCAMNLDQRSESCSVLACSCHFDTLHRPTRTDKNRGARQRAYGERSEPRRSHTALHPLCSHKTNPADPRAVYATETAEQSIPRKLIRCRDLGR
jgi:hypothetical protein